MQEEHTEPARAVYQISETADPGDLSDAIYERLDQALAMVLLMSSGGLKELGDEAQKSYFWSLERKLDEVKGLFRAYEEQTAKETP